MFKQLKDIIGISVNKAGLNNEFKALSVINEYKKVARDVLGDESVEHLIPRSFKNGILKIEARGASWASMLHIKRVEIIRRLNLVKKINIRIVDQGDESVKF